MAQFEEDVKGTLAPGMFADFVVLSNNLLTVAEEQIPSTQVLMTFVGGELKYEADDAMAAVEDAGVDTLQVHEH